MEIEETANTNEQNDAEDNIPVFATHEIDEEDNFPLEIEDSDEDIEDIKIKPSDAILMTGKIEAEFASIEVYVFDEKTENLFVHHDFILSSFPVCLDWFGANFSKIEGD